MEEEEMVAIVAGWYKMDCGYLLVLLVLYCIIVIVCSSDGSYFSSLSLL